jgi:hypothetical protein
MSFFKLLSKRLSDLLPARTVERDVDDELSFHIEMRVCDNLELGMPLAEAREDALRRFGDFERVKLVCCKVRRRNMSDMKWLKIIFWSLAITGVLVRSLSSIEDSFRPMGDLLIVIGLLGRLLIYVRSVRPAARASLSNGKSVTVGADEARGAIRTPLDANQERLATGRAVPFDQRGRTPVERILSDE